MQALRGAVQQKPISRALRCAVLALALPCAGAPQVKKEGKAKFKLGVAEAKLGSAIQVGRAPAVLRLLAPAALCLLARRPGRWCRAPGGW